MGQGGVRVKSTTASVHVRLMYVKSLTVVAVWVVVSSDDLFSKSTSPFLSHEYSSSLPPSGDSTLSSGGGIFAGLNLSVMCQTPPRLALFLCCTPSAVSLGDSSQCWVGVSSALTVTAAAAVEFGFGAASEGYFQID